MIECWNPKTKIICRSLGISMDGNDCKCAAKSSRKLIDQQGDKKTPYFKRGVYTDDDHWCIIVCPEGCTDQDLYNQREDNL